MHFPAGKKSKRIPNVATVDCFLRLCWKSNHLNVAASSCCSVNFTCLVHRLLIVAILMASSIFPFFHNFNCCWNLLLWKKKTHIPVQNSETKTFFFFLDEGWNQPLLRRWLKALMDFVPKHLLSDAKIEVFLSKKDYVLSLYRETLQQNLDAWS